MLDNQTNIIFPQPSQELTGLRKIEVRPAYPIHRAHGNPWLFQPLVGPMEPGRWEMRGLTGQQVEEITRKREMEDNEDFDTGDYLLCSNCKHVVTTTAEKIEITGKHHHTFTNPRGFIYKIGCFGAAPGVLNQGAPTLEFTWFSGYSWCYSLCVRCFAHLGWFFESSDKNFYGLILDHLIEETRGRP